MKRADAHAATAAHDRFAGAWRALHADASIQFTLPPAAPPPGQPAWLRHALEWLARALRPIWHALRWLGRLMPDAPYARILLWSVLALAALALAWFVYERVRHGEWRLPRRRARGAAVPVDPEEAWTAEAAPLRAWLREADALAAQGRYAEAVHHLLFRSVEDIQRRRPQAVRPALTSRELADAPAVPERARMLFAAIARLVERSLFGGRPVDRDEWTAARAAYADLAAPGAWRG